MQQAVLTVVEVVAVVGRLHATNEHMFSPSAHIGFAVSSIDM